jgi:RNA polymerase sigma-70 factor (ECF subfamily)
VFVLREVEGFSVAETAELLQISETNVKVRLNRAKALLQKGIEQYYSHPEIYSFNLIYCDAIVQRVFEKINILRQRNDSVEGPFS